LFVLLVALFLWIFAKEAMTPFGENARVPAVPMDVVQLGEGNCRKFSVG